MPTTVLPALLLALVALLGSLPALSQKRTLCTITVNSADEREAFRAHLPADRYEFVELVERGRPDWLASACRRKVSCDVLIVSGHFAGTEFYSSKPHIDESLPVDEIERVACSDSCPDLFGNLKEAYLFGCDSLKPDPVKSATPEIVRSLVRTGHGRAEAEHVAKVLSQRHGESSRDRMRRVFPNVPVIYGFSALAPYGRVAGPMLHGYFRSLAGDDIGSGRPSSRLLALFAPSSMVVTTGLRDTDPHADYRAEVCRFYDDRLTLAQKVGAIQALLGRETAEVRMSFDRIEKFFGALSDAQRRESTLAAALTALAREKTLRDRFLTLTRDTADPALRVRMIALARGLEWLTLAEQRVELVALIGDVMTAGGMGFGEVDLICRLGREHALEGERHRLKGARVDAVVNSAALACLGSGEGRARVLQALSSADERDVQVAQAYLRHRPITDADELRAAAVGIARMPGTGAQVRALDTLGRHHIADREVALELARLFQRASSLNVQRAIAEIFLRADAGVIATPEIVAVLRRHRLKAPGGAPDLIDTLLERLSSRT